MGTSSELRSIGILVGICMLGCASSTSPVASPVAPPVVEATPGEATECPYASVYVAVSTNGSVRDTKVAKRVQLAYTEYLGERGFSVVSAPNEAYWNAFSLVRLNRRIDSSFAWSVYMMATEDLGGDPQSPVDFAAEGDAAEELSGFMLLKEVRLLELDLQVRQAAADTAGALLPHTSRMCVAWASPTTGEQAARMGDRWRMRERKREKIRNLRDELTQEIVRVRRDRQGKRVHVDVDEPADF